MGIKFKGEKITIELKGIVRRSRDLSKPMKGASMLMKEGVQSNILKEKTYDGIAWKKSKRAEEQGGKTLRDTGRLFNSFTTDSGKNFAQVGTNVKYARVLNRGAKKGEFGKTTYTVKEHQRQGKNGMINVKSHSRTGIAPWGDITAYRYMGFTKEELNKIYQLIRNHIIGRY